MRSVGNAVLETQCWKRSVGNAVLGTQCWKHSVGNAALETQCWETQCWETQCWETQCWQHNAYLDLVRPRSIPSQLSSTLLFLSHFPPPLPFVSCSRSRYLESDDGGDGAVVPAVQMSYGDAFSNTDKETDLRFRAKGALDRIAHDESKRRHRKEHESDRQSDPEHIVYDPSTRDTEVDDILGKVDAIARRAESGGHSPGGRRRPSKPKQAGDHGGEGHSRRGHEKPSHRRKRHAGNGTIKYSKKEVRCSLVVS